MTEIITHYHPALLTLTLLCLSILIQSVMCAIFAFSETGGQKPGRVVGGPEQHSFRVLRTYLNSTESLPMFIGVLFAAMLTGVSPKWVNILAGLHLGFRLLFWAIYYSKLGIKTPGLRTIGYLGGMLTNFALGVMTVIALVNM